MKFKHLIPIVAILILFVSALAGYSAKSARDKEPSKKEQPKKEESYSSSKSRTKQSLDQKELSESTEKVTEKPGELVKVTRIVNGDTIVVRFPDGRDERVRYIGIDTWETKDQPHGGHGTEANRALVEGKEILLVKDVSERNRYDRLLRYVYVGDVSVNARLVTDGHAKAKDYPPDSAFAAVFAELERQAKAKGKGCWVDSAGEEPSSDFVGNRISKKLHNLDHAVCRRYVVMMNDNNKLFYSSEEYANVAGFYTCDQCP